MDKNLEQEINQNVKQEMEAIKKDMQDVLNRLGNLKGQASEYVGREIECWTSSLYDIQGKATSKGRQTLGNLTWCIHQHPLRCVATSFGAGLLLALLLKR